MVEMDDVVKRRRAKTTGILGVGRAEVFMDAQTSGNRHLRQQDDPPNISLDRGCTQLSHTISADASEFTVKAGQALVS